MSSPEETVLRLIKRQETLIDSGQSPDPAATTDIINYITKKSVLGNASIRSWLIALDVPHVLRLDLLKLVKPMISAGFPSDAASLFRNLMGLEDPSKWTEIHRGWLSNALPNKGVETVLSSERLISDNAESWGRAAIDLLAGLLLVHQRRECSEKAEFSPNYDSYRFLWYFEDDSDSHEAYYQLAKTLEKALQEATEHDTPDSFFYLAENLVECKWGLAVALPLAALYDALHLPEQRKGWHEDAAIKLLVNPCVVQYVNASRWRRLIRKQFSTEVSQSDKGRIVETIRQADLGDKRRINELADVEDWGLLNDVEKASIKQARLSGNLYPEQDPRPQRGRHSRWEIEWQASPIEDELASEWPYPKERDYIKVLARRKEESEQQEIDELEQDLLKRRAALEAVISKPEIDEEKWVGRSLEWCRNALRDLKHLARNKKRRQAQTRELTLDEYVDLLAERVPWWSSRGEKALEILQQPVPEYHKTEKTDLIVWQGCDVFFAAVSYMDELLAGAAGAPLDTYRNTLAAVTTSNWDTWPAFTRATVLLAIRDYNWNTIPSLASFLESKLLQESDASVVKIVFHKIARYTPTDLLLQLRSLLSRAVLLDQADELLSDIGEFAGSSYAHFCTEENSSLREETKRIYQEIQELSLDLCLRVGDSMLWGATTYLKSKKSLTQSHAQAFCELANWIIPAELESREEENKLGQSFESLNLVGKCEWSDQQLSYIIEALADTLELILLKGGLGDFIHFHYRLPFGPRGSEEGDTTEGVAAETAYRQMSDRLLLRLCKASATNTKSHS